jgi:hypothetical protein
VRFVSNGTHLEGLYLACCVWVRLSLVFAIHSKLAVIIYATQPFPKPVAYPGIFSNSVANKGQRVRGSGVGILLVRGSTQLANL